MDRLYGKFVRPGDLVFDVGAHVGDRIASFQRLGARVVAVEPQPAMVRVLRLLYGRSKSVTIEALAVGREPGRARMLINVDNPTVSSISPAFVEAAHDAPGWETQRWGETIDVAVTTLDALIAKHGVPAFIKLDVEGFEAEALSGLSLTVRAVSFEFTTIQRDGSAKVGMFRLRRGACLHRAVRSDGLRALQRSPWRKPDADRGLDECAGHRSLAD